MDQHSFLSSPSIHSEKWIFGHAVCFAHQVSHTTHVVLIVSLHTKALIPVRPIEVGYLGAGRWLGQWIHHLIPFTTPPHFIPCSHLAQIKKDIIPNLSLNHQCLKFPSLSHVASEAIEQILLRWVKLERQPIGQKFCLGRDVSVYFFPTVMNKVKVILAWLWCPIFQMLATRWRASKVLGYLISTHSVQFSSVQLLSHMQLFVTPWTAACQASLSITTSRSLLKLMSIESGIPSKHLILCCPLLLPPWIFPSIRVFSSESVLHIRCPKYWSFSFSISPSNEYSGLISFRMDWLDLLAVQGILKSLLQHHSSKASILWHSAFFIVQLSHPYMTTGKTITLTRQIFVSKVMSVILNKLSRLVITYLPRSNVYSD